MIWTVILHEAFDKEYGFLDEEVQDALLARLKLLSEFGPELSRPHVDILSGSRHANMKEIRFTCTGGVYRAAFAFDPERQAIILIMANKAGVNQKRFYKKLIATADQRLDNHLETREMTNG